MLCVCVYASCVFVNSSIVMQALLQRNAKKHPRSPSHIVQYNVKTTWVMISGGLCNFMSFGLHLQL